MCIQTLHSFGPYGNVCDKFVSQFVGTPLVKCDQMPLWGGQSQESVQQDSHQESWPPMHNKVQRVDNLASVESTDNVILCQRNLGFVLMTPLHRTHLIIHR